MSAFKVTPVLTVRLELEAPRAAFVFSHRTALVIATAIQNDVRRSVNVSAEGPYSLEFKRFGESVRIKILGGEEDTRGWRVDATELFEALKEALGGKL